MDKSSIGIPSKNLNSKNINVNLLKYINPSLIIFSLMSFFLSRAILIGSIAPLGIAFFLGMSKLERYKVPLFISTLAGILLSGNSMAYIAKYIVCLVIFMIISKKIKNNNSYLKISFIGAFIVFPISIGQVILSDKYLYDILLCSMEAIITFISIYIFLFGINLMMNIKNRISVNVEETIALSFIVIFSIIGIGNIEILSISIQTILATVLILTICIVGGPTMGASSGVIVGIAFLINNISSVIYMGVYSVAGLVGGTLNKLGKYFSILGYILSWIMVYGYTSGLESNMSQIRDILIASLIVVLLPNNIFKKLEKIIKLNVESNDVVYDYIKRSKDMTSSKLVNMYKAYDELANIFDKIREKDKVIDTRDIANIIDMIHSDECRNCSMRRRCWDLNFNHTYTLMGEILEDLEEHGQVTLDSISTEFKKECLKPEEIVKVANYYYKLFLVDYNWSLRFSESRKLIGNQIKSISKSIESLSKDLEGNIVLDLQKEKYICDQLQRSGINVNKVSYISKGLDDFEITIDKNTCSDGCMCENKLIQVVSDIVEENITAQKIGCHSLGGRCKISFTKAQKYKAITEVAGMSRDGHILCGDNYTYMDINDGKYMVAISDGMGKGKKAYEESYITIDILEKMMDAKIDDEIVINTINNMLLLKSSDEEMFSTLDLGIIDLKRGILETIKMGACSTYIKRSEEDIDLISSSSLPVGILSDIKLDRKSTKVKYGDYIVMVSDGILDAGKNNNLGDNWLIYFLKQIKTTNPKEIANLILDRALEIQEGSVEDDMTVLVTKICSN